MPHRTYVAETLDGPVEIQLLDLQDLVSCPSCGAHKGIACRSRGSKKGVRHPHDARWQKWRTVSHNY